MAERSRAQLFLDSIVSAVVAGFLGAIKRLDRRRSADFAGALMRRIGPFLPEHRVGRDNLRAAFPQKSEDEIEKILAGVWDNLGRIAVEFAHLDEFCIADFGRQTPDVITYTLETKIRYDTMAASGHAILGFAAHLANWELPAVVAKTLGTNGGHPLSAAEYRCGQRHDRQDARAADGLPDTEQPRRTGADGAACA